MAADFRSHIAPLKLIIFQPSQDISILYYVLTMLRLQNFSFSGTASNHGMPADQQSLTSGKKRPQVSSIMVSQLSSLLLPPIARLMLRVQILADIPELFFFR